MNQNIVGRMFQNAPNSCTLSYLTVQIKIQYVVVRKGREKKHEIFSAHL